MTFLVVRPKSKVNNTVNELKRAGLHAYPAPLMDIEISHKPSCWRKLADANPDILIVTSTYAASWLCSQVLTEQLSLSRIVAIGNSTAQLLAQAFPHVTLDIALPENSEGALILPCLQTVTNTRIAIVKGSGGRDMLPNTLGARGANVSTIDVYSRVQNKAFKQSEAFKPTQIQCIIVTSVELGQLALNVFDQKWCSNLHWIVASQRIKDYAVSQGISKITVSDGASNHALVECAQHLVRTGVVNV